MSIDNRLAVLSLIACDDSYWSSWPLGDPLVTKPDSKAVNGDLEPDPIPEHLMQGAGLQFTYLFKGAYRIEGWRVAASVTDVETGFGAVIFQNAAKTQAVIAFTGTNGLTPQGLQGWFTNLALARTQWDPANQVAVLRAINELQGPDGTPGSFAGTINFTGQSLGGALAQYAMYDYASAAPGFDASRVTLTTFNALGVIDALSSRPDFELITDLVADVQTAHYTTYNDIVHRLGGGYLNGSGNTYQFRFTRTVPGYDYYDDAGNLYRIPAREVAYDFVDAHRIESGFYRGFTKTGSDFASAKPYTPSLISAEAARTIADGFGNLLNDRDHYPAESFSRLVAGITASVAINPIAARELAYELLHSMKLQATTIPSRAIWGAFETVVPLGLQIAHLHPLSRVPLLGAATYALAIAAALDAGEEIGQGAASLREYLIDAVENARLRSPGNIADFEFASSFIDDTSLIEQQTKALAAMALASSTLPGLTAEWSAVLIDDMRAVMEAFHSENWAPDLLRYVTKRIYEANAAAGASPDQIGRSVGEALSVVSKGIYTLGAQTLDASVDAAAALQDLAQHLQHGVVSVARALSNAYGQLTLKFADAFDWGTAVSRQTVNATLQGLVASAKVDVDRVGPSLDDAISTLELAAQVVVVRPGREQNPFDDEAFEPDALPVSTGALQEGRVSTFTLYLPYEAGVGGQRVRLELEGAGAEDLSVLAAGEQIELEAGGTFIVTVAEGQREASFSIVADADLDADATLTLRATLVNAAGEATHLEHEEATIALDSEMESAPTGGREIRGDWAPKPYDDGFGVYYKIDDLWNYERLPGVPNTMGIGEPDHVLQGSSGSDHIVAADQLLEVIYADAGDDVLADNENWWMYANGGAGDDWIEALGYAYQAGDQFEWEYFGRTIKRGEDKIYGGGGNDQIYGESAATVDSLYDPSVTPTGLLGDWTSGGSGADRIYGGAGDDVLMGGTGEDRLVGGAGKDVLLGDDHYIVRPESNLWTVVHPNFGDFTSGFGAFEVGLFPVVNATSVSPDFISAPTGDPDFMYYKFGGAADVLIGGAGDDILIGQAGDDVAYGGDDNDILAGWEGADALYGGSGDDRIAGDFGGYEQVNQRGMQAPQLVGPGVLGSPGAYGTAVDQAGADFLDGGGGNDVLHGEGGNDVVLGGDGADVLFGDATYLPAELHGDDLLDGGAGSDQLFGGGGEDKLYGGDGDDVLSGGAGNDLLEGGAGSDSLDAGEGDDVLQAGAGSDTLSGGAGADELHAGAGDDGLDGGEGHDVLHGDAGADRLEGGAGNDTLFGGSGDDLVDGGDGDDVIDGGAGADILRGGEGNDTYRVGSGYGRELIEDSHGENRIRFGPGILPEDLAAELDPATLAVTLSFGAGDAVSLNLGQVEIGGVDFSNGTAWTRSRLIDFLPAVASQGSGASDALVGNPRLKNELRGEAGDDILQGASYADYLAGGDGNDSLDGKSGSDRYFFAADESGVDLLADSGVAARAYLDWFYQSRGIADWAERANRGGQYRVQGERNDDRGQFVEYFDTYEEAYEEHPFATIFYVEPLPELAPLVTRNNAEALAELSGAGVLDEDFVEFGAGLGLSDLELTLAVPASFANEYPEQPWYGGGHLSVRWGAAGFDVQVPGVAYGFAGSDLLGSSQDDDEENEDGSWRGYRLGEGVEAFHFADGSSYTLEQILQQAVVVPGHVLLRGSGEQIIDRRSPEVVFEPGIEVADVAITREGVDLVLRLNDFSASGRIEGWFADPANVPDIGLRFADGASISAPQVTEIALTQQGSPFDDVLQSIDGFPNRLHGMGGNDVLHGADGEDLLEGSEGDDHLDGGAGKDTYVFNQGDGIDTITDEPSGADDASVIVFGPDIHPWQIRPGLGSLVLNYGASDAIHFSAFDPDDPYTAPAFERLEFHDGSSLSYQQVLGLGFQLFGSEDDDVISATGLDDFIDGAAGNDTLDGRGGADIVVGGDGDDTLAGGAGDGDFVDGGDGSDTYIYAFGDGYDQIADWDEALDDVDVLRLTGGILPADVRITRDDWSYHLVLGTADRVVLDSMAREPVAEIERIEFDEGTIWTATDLASRVELLPGTERGDMLWGSAGADSIEGLGGDDSLFGNAGDDFLAGGEGSDFYYFGAGDGADVVDNADTDGSFDSIFFAEASSTYARVARSGEDLVIRIGSGSDRVTLLGWYSDFNRKIDDVSFAGDGAFWDAATLEALALREGGNSAPELSIPIADQEATEDAAFNFTVPEHTFLDPDAGDTLHYSASELPAWLSFDAGTRAFSGTPANADVDSYEIKVTATDTFGESASHTFWVEVLNTNDAPVVGAALLEHFGREGEPLNFTLPSDAFIDVDTGDSLTLAANLADGAPLPDWLAFENGTFDGTPRRADRGEYLIQITAIDAAGASASANFGLAVSDSLARGNRLVGTRRNDVLNGTNADEFLVGRAGSDHLLGGAGDDVLSGGRGNDKLSGGLGQDVYIHSPRGGHDKIDEAGAAGEMDVLRLGEGIKRNMVRASRHRDDLVLDLSGPHGSVTVKDWFRSSAQRVERIEFADGTSWDEKAIRKAARHWHADDGHEPARHDAHRDERSNYVADERRGRRDDQPAQDGAAAISGRLSRSLSFDFEALARELERTERQEKPLTPQQIQRQWAAVQRYVSALGLEGEQDDASLAGWRDFSAASLLGANGFGFEASVGAARGPENLNSLEGLSEGFRRL